MIILIGTVVTSLQAFKDERIIDKYILHPWSIANHNPRHYTLISCRLIHADPVHLMMNIMSFSFFAFPLETIIGHWRFLTIYVGSLIFSSFFVTAKNRNNAYFRCLGASGAIAGIIFSYMARNRYENIAHDAHLWGAISGALITMVVDPGVMNLI
jgi:membrane associated rhomboid family serine protease